MAIVSSKLIDDIIIGQSAPAKELKKLIEVVAEAPTSVLVLGETGTGKELVARAIHAASGRSGRLISVNCAAIPSELLESEIFGHEKGAFTGADKPREGRVELARGGTLFLDEIGDMPLPLQTKLLRVLENRTVQRVGGNNEIEIDFRLVCATHQNIQERVDQGAFRADLYFRLRGMEVRLPALRERADRDDIIAQIAREEAPNWSKPRRNRAPQANAPTLHRGTAVWTAVSTAVSTAVLTLQQPSLWTTGQLPRQPSRLPLRQPSRWPPRWPCRLHGHPDGRLDP